MDGAGSSVVFSRNWSTCAATMMAAFLGKPQVQPDVTCANAKYNPDWITIK